MNKSPKIFMANKKFHVSWSGGEKAKTAAQSFCQANNCVMLEMTHIAKYKEWGLHKEHKRLEKQWWSQKAIWFIKELPEREILSRDFAVCSSHNNVYIFIDVSYGEQEDMVGREYREKPWLN